MCFSYAVNFDRQALQARMQLDDFEIPEPGYFFSAFTYPLLPVIVRKNDKNDIRNMHWGLIPRWCANEEKALQLRQSGLNCRGETAKEKPLFRDAFKHSRCLIPAAGFYEWREARKKKYPYFIQPANDEYFLFGGLYSQWVNPATGEEVQTYAIVTCPSNELMGKIHNTKMRMPLILSYENGISWMKESTEVAESLVIPAADTAMKAFTVGREVSQSRADRNVLASQKEFIYPELEQDLPL